MLLSVAAVVGVAASVPAIQAVGAGRDAAAALRRATDYSNYRPRGEDTLSNADLWDRKIADGYSAGEATAYVRNRPGGDAGTDRLGDTIPDRLPQLHAAKNSADLRLVVFGAVALAAAASAWALLWGWLGARRKPPPTLAVMPTEGELTALERHLAYEVAALSASAERFGVKPTWLALEGFLLHARLLREFFLGRWDARAPHAASAVLAEHYFADPSTWRNRKSAVSRKVLDETRTAIDKQVAHLTKEREASFEQLEPKVPALQAELSAMWSEFLSALGSDPRAERLRRAVDDIRPRL